MPPVIAGKPCYTVKVQVSVSGSKQGSPPGKRFPSLCDLYPAFLQARVTGEAFLPLSQYGMYRFSNISILY